jgi:hypothetical protein
VKGNDPHGGHRRVCEGDRARVGVSHGIVEVKLLCFKFEIKNISVLDTILSQINPVHARHPFLFNINFNIIVPFKFKPYSQFPGDLLVPFCNDYFKVCLLLIN